MDDQSEPLSAPLRVDAIRTDDVVHVAIAGEVDMATADTLSEALRSAIAAGPTRRVVIDLAEVTFLASSGISALIRAHHLASAQQATLTVINCPPIIAEILELTGVARTLMPAGEPSRQA